MPRLLGIDYGEKRIGLALSDPTETIATPHSVLERKDLERDLRALAAIVDEEAVAAYVVGAPLHDDGTRSPMCERVEAFVEKLLAVKQLPVHWIDEGFSSLEAEEILRRSIRDWRKRRERIDMIAAQLILQSFLDRRRPKPAPIPFDEEP